MASDVVTITVPGVPVAQPRQRVTKTGFNYTPTRHPANAWKAAVAIEWRNTTQQPPMEGPVRLSVEFVLPRTQSRPGKVPVAFWSKTQRVVHPSKPDLDNLLKAVKDALTKLAWKDDSQVWQVYATKQYAGLEDQPHATITVEPETEIDPL